MSTETTNTVHNTYRHSAQKQMTHTKSYCNVYANSSNCSAAQVTNNMYSTISFTMHTDKRARNMYTARQIQISVVHTDKRARNRYNTREIQRAVVQTEMTVHESDITHGKQKVVLHTDITVHETRITHVKYKELSCTGTQVGEAALFRGSSRAEPVYSRIPSSWLPQPLGFSYKSLSGQPVSSGCPHSPATVLSQFFLRPPGIMFSQLSSLSGVCPHPSPVSVLR